jgi:PAS domain S-box-containing protein
MKKNTTRSGDKADLKRRAEEKLKKKPKKQPGQVPDLRSELAAQSLVHELQVHQIELEMQNEELREAQTAIEESRAQYEDLYDFSPLAYFTFDRKGNIRAVNLTGATLLEKNRKLLINSKFSHYLDAASADIFVSHLEQVFAGAKKQTCELLLRTKGRRQIPVVLESVRAEDGHGGIDKCRCAVIDITRLKQAEEALREREELFRVTFEKSPIGKVMIGLDQKITCANQQLCDLLGYTEEEIRGMNLRDIAHPDDIDAFLKNFRLMSAGEIDSYKMEKRYLRKDGGIVWGQLTARLIRDSAGRPLYGLGLIEDITSRRQAQRYQLLAAEILRTLNNPSTFDNSINLILTAIKQETGFDAIGLRLKSGDDFPYFAEKGFTDDFLLTENTLLARNTNGGFCQSEDGGISLECTCGRVLSGPTERANSFLTEGGSFWTNNSLSILDLTPEEDPRLHPRNNCIHQGYMSVALIPIHAAAETVGLLQLNDRRKDRFTPAMIQLFEWIAESIGVALLRKQAETILEERTAQLEAANKELESFSYSVSHDLRAPLRAIDGFSRMILKRKGNEFDKETKRQFGLIRNNTQTMSRLIDDILAFSRLGKQAMAVSPIDMDGLVREIWETLRTASPGRQLNLKVNQLPKAAGDQALIRQVLTNLLSNAVKFTGFCESPVIEVGGYTSDKEKVYYVRDNGAGFDMEYYHKLFGVFQRLHTADEFEGTGVGLAIVQRIIHRHGGRVWAEGEVDKGATFYFTL